MNDQNWTVNAYFRYCYQVTYLSIHKKITSNASAETNGN